MNAPYRSLYKSAGTGVSATTLQPEYEAAFRRHYAGVSASAPTVSDVPGGYDGLDGTFANACRKADRHFRRQLEKQWRASPGVLAAASSVVEALVYSLRERGIPALEEPDTQHRLTQLSEDQFVEVGDRLQKLKPHIARAWSDQEIAALIIVRNECLAKIELGV
jgi:hypothetical protein